MVYNEKSIYGKTKQITSKEKSIYKGVYHHNTSGVLEGLGYKRKITISFFF